MTARSPVANLDSQLARTATETGRPTWAAAPLSPAFALETGLTRGTSVRGHIRSTVTAQQ